MSEKQQNHCFFEFYCLFRLFCIVFTFCRKLFAFFVQMSWCFFVFFQLCQRFCQEMANLQKNEKHVLYKNAKKMRFHDSAEHAANPMQKNANEKCKSTPNIKLLTKKCKSDMQIYRKKIKKTIHFQHPSLYQTNSHNLKHSAPWSKTAATKQNHTLCIKYKCILATEDKGLWPSQATSGFSRFPPSFPTDLLCKWLHHLQCFHR